MTSGQEQLIDRVRGAVALADVEATCERVKHDLEDLVRDGGLRLEARFGQPLPDRYARRLLYRDPATGFTVVVMTWGPGQKTPLHDHAGIWCVEGVVEGRMEVERFELLDEDGGRCRFVSRGHVHAGPGSAGALIPPFEYHTLGNALADRPSITVHVYGGEMDHCSIFEPQHDGHWLRRERPLSYSD